MVCGFLEVEKVDFVKRCCGQSEQLICLHWVTVAVVFLSFGSTAVCHTD